MSEGCLSVLMDEASSLGESLVAGFPGCRCEVMLYQDRGGKWVARAAFRNASDECYASVHSASGSKADAVDDLIRQLKSMLSAS